jgi:hypothetical protein
MDKRKNMLESKLVKRCGLNGVQAVRMAEGIREIICKQSALTSKDYLSPLVESYTLRMECPGPELEEQYGFYEPQE